MNATPEEAGGRGRRRRPGGRRLRRRRRRQQLRRHHDRRGGAATTAAGGAHDGRGATTTAAGGATTAAAGTAIQFKPLDVGGPLTIAALENGDIQMGLLFSSDGTIAENGWVALEDDKQLQPVENLVAVGNAEKLTDDYATAIDGALSKLTTEELQALNVKMNVDKEAPADVAAAWLEENDLLAEEPALDRLDHDRLVELQRAGARRRDGRPGPRGPRRRRQPQVQAGRPRGRGAGARERRHRRLRRVRRQLPHVPGGASRPAISTRP